MADEKKPEDKKPEKKKNSGIIWWILALMFLGPMAINLLMSSLTNVMYLLGQGMEQLALGAKELLKPTIRFMLMILMIIGVFIIFGQAVKAMTTKKKETEKV